MVSRCGTEKRACRDVLFDMLAYSKLFSLNEADQAVDTEQKIWEVEVS